jgi:hypothetical protein
MKISRLGVPFETFQILNPAVRFSDFSPLFIIES